MPIDRNKKMTYAEFLEVVDDDIKRVATGSAAQAKYEEVLMRIADALEHQVINHTMTLLAAPSEDFPHGRTAPLYISGHLGSCGACTMLRKAEAVKINPIVQAAMRNAKTIIGG